MPSYTIAHYVILMMTLHNVETEVDKNISANPNNFMSNLIKKMNAFTLCFGRRLKI